MVKCSHAGIFIMASPWCSIFADFLRNRLQFLLDLFSAHQPLKLKSRKVLCLFWHLMHHSPRILLPLPLKFIQHFILQFSRQRGKLWTGNIHLKGKDVSRSMLASWRNLVHISHISKASSTKCIFSCTLVAITAPIFLLRSAWWIFSSEFF